MPTHELNLIENAVDSLKEALAKFDEGEKGNLKAYKFAVQHMSHFVELIFKHHVATIHPLLIFKEPFSRKINTDRTIGLWDAINFIANESPDAISSEFRADLEWIKKLRNDIEHHKFSLDIQQTRQTLGRLFRSVLEFLEFATELDISDFIEDNEKETFQILANEYEMARRDAIRAADEFDEENTPDYSSDPDAPPPRVDCWDCGNPTCIINDESPTGYRCLLCGSEYSDEIPAHCDICGVMTTLGELATWEDDEGRTEARCYYCSGQYHADKDD